MVAENDREIDRHCRRRGSSPPGRGRACLDRCRVMCLRPMLPRRGSSEMLVGMDLGWAARYVHTYTYFIYMYICMLVGMDLGWAARTVAQERASRVESSRGRVESSRVESSRVESHRRRSSMTSGFKSNPTKSSQVTSSHVTDRLSATRTGGTSWRPCCAEWWGESLCEMSVDMAEEHLASCFDGRLRRYGHIERMHPRHEQFDDHLG